MLLMCGRRWKYLWATAGTVLRRDLTTQANMAEALSGGFVSHSSLGTSTAGNTVQNSAVDHLLQVLQHQAPAWVCPSRVLRSWYLGLLVSLMVIARAKVEASLSIVQSPFPHRLRSYIDQASCVLVLIVLCHHLMLRLLHDSQAFFIRGIHVVHQLCVPSCESRKEAHVCRIAFLANAITGYVDVKNTCILQAELIELTILAQSQYVSEIVYRF